MTDVHVTRLNVEPCQITGRVSGLPSYKGNKALVRDWHNYLLVCAEDEHQVFMVQQLAGVCDVDGRLGFVPCQHPHLHASPSQSLDGFWDVFLETVLNASGPCGHTSKCLKTEYFSMFSIAL